MYHIFTSPLSISLTLATTFGVLIHDTRIDRATATAIAAPVIVATYGISEIAQKFGDAHPHIERVNVASEQPRVQPRSNGEDRKYVMSKKMSINTSSGEYSWPSI